MPAPLNIQPGDRFGRLVIVREAEKVAGYRHFVCRCDCGGRKTVRLTRLTTASGPTRSCGCLARERARARATKHGLSGGWRGRASRLYVVWASMKSRCQNPNKVGYANYGGRGIRLCDEWQEFKPFLEWARSSGYHKNLSIDRIDNNGDYEPANCRWATRRQQNLNTRRNRLLSYQGETKPVRAWADELGLSYSALLTRLQRGWSVERALTEPPRPRHV